MSFTFFGFSVILFDFGPFGALGALRVRILVHVAIGDDVAAACRSAGPLSPCCAFESVESRAPR
jgi:hypothetical protein